MPRAVMLLVALAASAGSTAFAAESAAVEKKSEAATQVYVRTAPPGAAVRLNGSEEGTAPGIFVVPPGVTKLTIEVELGGVKEARTVEVRGGKIMRVEFELGKEGGRAAGASSPAPAHAVAPARTAAPFPAEAADGDGVRAAVAKFVTRVQGGEKDKAIEERFAKDAEDPRESLAVYEGAVGAGIDPVRIRCVFMDKERTHAIASTYPGKDGAVLAYTLKACPEGWRIDEIFLGRPEAGASAIDDREESSWFDISLEYVLPALKRRVAELLDLDTGVFVTMENFGADDRVTHAWIRERKVDAVGVVEKGTAGVLLFDVAAIDVPPDKWGTITREEIADHALLKQKEPDKITPCVCEPSSPVPTRIFRTREGALGILQVLGAREAADGVKIRCRLLNAQPRVSTVRPGVRAHPAVRLVIGADGMTFQGLPATWEDLPKLLDAVPERDRTDLELAAASADLPFTRITEAMEKLRPLQERLGFRRLHIVGSPPDSKGGADVLRGRVDFRLVPVREEGRLLGLTDEDIARYTAELQAKGPVRAQYGKEPFVWCRVARALTPNEKHITARYEGRSYVLLSHRPAETMLTLFGDSNPWRLVDAVITLESGMPDRPSIALRLDKEGGWRMGALTEAHVNMPLAALVDDEVLSMPVIRARVGDAIVVTGAFTHAEVEELVARLKSGVSR